MSRPQFTNERQLPVNVTVPVDGRILFFRRDRQAYFWLSHFYAAEIVIDGEAWPTVEHYFQACKSHDPVYKAAIRNSVHPGMAKRLGAAPEGPRKVAGQSWFRAHGQKHRADWRDVRLEIMRQADFAKFSQHEELRNLLLATGVGNIIEDCEQDSYWGIGSDGQGDNWAGKVLMEVRHKLREIA